MAATHRLVPLGGSSTHFHEFLILGGWEAGFLTAWIVLGFEVVAV